MTRTLSRLQALTDHVSFQGLDVRSLRVRKGRRLLLRDVSLAVDPGDIVVILGPNGAGKTTLLKAIGGERPSAGTVHLNGHNLYAAPEHWLKNYIGQVPSRSVLHENLSVREALIYAGELRLSLPAEEIEERVEDRLEEFDLPEGRWDALVGKLSDGERKLANICAELLAEPPLLLLDEPTTGLDPHHVKVLVTALRRRARQPGRAVVFTSHTMDTLDLLLEEDQVPGYAGSGWLPRSRIVFMANGEIVEQGSPDPDSSEGILKRLGCEDWPGAFGKYKTTEQAEALWSILREWRPGPFSRNGYDQQLTVERDGQLNPGAIEIPEASVARQFWVLVRRNWRVLLNDGWQIPFARFVLPLRLFVILGLGPVVGMLLALVLERESYIESPSLYGRDYSWMSDVSDVRQAVFLLALVVALMGLTGSFREIANEIHIYRHERLKGLTPAAYLLAKGALLVPLFGVIMPVFLLFTLQWRQLGWSQAFPQHSVVLTSFTEAAITLVFASVAAISLGLAISAIGSTREHATVLLAFAVVYHALLSGLVTNQEFGLWIDRLSALVASRWAMEGVSTSLGVYCWEMANPQFKDFPSIGHLTSIWLWLGGYALIAAAIAYLSLRAKDRWYGALHLGRLPPRGVVLSVSLIFLLLFNGWFVRGLSRQYYELRTDVDVDIADVTSRTSLQHLVGVISEARCPDQEEDRVEPPGVSTTEIPTLIPSGGALATPPVILAAPATPTMAPTEPSATPVPDDVETGTPQPEDTPAPLPSPTLPQPEATSTPSPPSGVQSLPVGVLPVSTELRYGPADQHPAAGSISPGKHFTLLGKSRGSPGWWFRVKIGDGPRAGRIGWIPVNHENLHLMVDQVSIVAAPPACAKAVANSADDFSTVDPSAGMLGAWASTVAGDTVFLIDLYRLRAGKRSPGLTFSLEVNGTEVRETAQSIAPTRKAFLWRNAVVHVDLKPGDEVQLGLRPADGLDAEPVYSFVSVFSVPRGCEFN